MAETKEAIEIIPKETRTVSNPVMPHEEGNVTIENLNVYLGKDGLAKEGAIAPRSVVIFGTLGVLAALLLGITTAWFIWGTTASNAPSTPASSVIPFITPQKAPLALEAPMSIRNSHTVTASLGEQLPVHIALRNTTKDALDHVVMSIKASGSLFDESRLELPFGRVEQGTITIDENSLPLLAHIPASSTTPLSLLGILPFVPESMKVSLEPATIYLALSATATRNNRAPPHLPTPLPLRYTRIREFLPKRVILPPMASKGRGLPLR